LRAAVKGLGAELRNGMIQRDKRAKPHRGLSRWCVVLVLVFALVALSLHFADVHTHAATGFHHDCMTCKAAMAAHGLLPGSTDLPEFAAVPTRERLRFSSPMAVAGFLQDSSPSRAPPQS